MLELLINTLEEFSGVEYLIKKSKTRRIENYNIKKQSEMFREVDITELLLTLYVTFTDKDEAGSEVKYRGSYNTEIHPGTSAEELRKIIGQGVFAAGFVKNAWYPLVTPESPAATVADDVTIDEKKVLSELQNAFYSSDTHKMGHICYSEFFLTCSDIRIINSSGVDISYKIHNAYIETAVHWRDEKDGEIEVFEEYRFSIPTDITAACEMLKSRVEHLFTVSEKKSQAVPTPQAENINILLTGECLAEFFSYYLTRANAQMVYQQLSTFKEGEQVQGGSGEPGDKLSLELLSMMSGSSHSRLCDDDGMPLSNHKIIEDGKLLKYWGNTRFSSYLGIPPTGAISNMCITGGTAKIEDLKREPYLELVSFSDFQVNPVTGDFISEIRLGFYFDGKKTAPVTGGSITGSITKVQDTMRMSTEQKQYNSYLGPATISITNATISGV